MDIFKKIDIFADGASINSSKKLIKKYPIQGFTTNPTLMHKEKITNYSSFSKKMLSTFHPLPIFIEIFEDSLEGMKKQAEIIGSWGKNVFIKIPITNTRGESTARLIGELSTKGFKINVTAVFTKSQINNLEDCFDKGTEGIISIFAGRIADTGRNPSEIVSYAVKKFKRKKNIKILWASTRQIYNIFEAINTGCDIITIPFNLLDKFQNLGKDLNQFSLETVKMFRNDALSSGYKII